MIAEPIPLTRQPTPDGLLCPHCGHADFKIYWQTFANGTRHVRADCDTCGKFVRYLKQDGAPDFRHESKPEDTHKSNHQAPPDSWDWIGFIRLEDNVWRAVALTPTLERCWDALLTYPARGDLLAIPTRPTRTQD